MIKNFNFYDVYGYFLPGIILVALLWLPFGLAKNQWPEEKIASALIAVVFGYVVGHILQTIATPFFPSTIKDSQSKRRYPSNVFLDSDNLTFSDEFKKKLSKQIRSCLNIDVNVNATIQQINAPESSIDRQRQDAFFLCRSVLIKSKTASYSEQFEGLYALMRGLALAFLLGLAFNAGWFSSGWRYPGIENLWWIVFLYGFIVAIVTSFFSRAEFKFNPKEQFQNAICVVVSLCFALFALGNYLGGEIGKGIEDRHRYLLLAIILGSLFSLLRCHAAFKEHAQNFAKAIYRDFYVYELTKENNGAGVKINNSPPTEDYLDDEESNGD